MFSSTAATYGEPERTPIVETDPTRPTNPYGASKLAIDTTLAEYAAPVRHRRGEPALLQRRRGVRNGTASGTRSRPTSIPNVLKVASGERESVSMFGTDYPTPDGTCVRDYIHVVDLAEAHLLALDACVSGVHEIFNLGSGSGYSVREVIDVCREVTGHEIPAVESPRRPGDPAVLIASSAKITERLGWKPERDLRAMVNDAWAFTRS